MGTAATLLVFGDLINMIKSGGTHKDLPLEERLSKNIERVGLSTQAGEQFLRGEILKAINILQKINSLISGEI